MLGVLDAHVRNSAPVNDVAMSPTSPLLATADAAPEKAARSRRRDQRSSEGHELSYLGNLQSYDVHKTSLGGTQQNFEGHQHSYEDQQSSEGYQLNYLGNPLSYDGHEKSFGGN